MLIENQLGYIQCAIGNTGRLSQQWLVEDAGSDYVRFRSKWLANQYINVEGQQGYAQYGTINSDWSSAMWTLEPQAVEVSVLVCARPCGIVTQARLTVRGNVLMVTQASPGANVTVYDVLGKTVLCQAVPKTGRLELKVARGIYFCKLTDSKLKASDALRIVVR